MEYTPTNVLQMGPFPAGDLVITMNSSHHIFDKKINWIKEYRSITECSLKEAIDAFERGILVPANTPDRDEKIRKYQVEMLLAYVRATRHFCTFVVDFAPSLRYHVRG